jgi:glutamate carboxypeptidase
MSENPQALLRWCEQEQGWIRRAVETLVRLESPSTDKTAVDRCGATLTAMLREIGADVREDVQAARGNHLRARIDGGPSRVLILGHFDTVWPVGQLARMPLKEEDGRLYGPGVFDMKSGIAVAMAAVRALRETNQDDAPTISMLWTTDEEIGSGTSRTLIEEEARASDAVLVLEPSLPGGAAKTSRKGCGEFELTVRGVSAHAGVDPSKGASAVLELVTQILRVQALQDLPRGVSVNVGLISGGSRPNVVPEEAHAIIDVRAPTMEDAARMEAAIRALSPASARTSIEISGGFSRPPLERGPHVARLYEIARAAAADLGHDLQEGGTGGGSDGNFTAALGVPTLDGLGPQGDGAHALHEHIVVTELPWRAAFLAAVLVRLGRSSRGAAAAR